MTQNLVCGNFLLLTFSTEIRSFHVTFQSMQSPITCLRLYCRPLRRLSPTFFCRSSYGSLASSRLPYPASATKLYKQAYSTQDKASTFLTLPREIPGRSSKTELRMRCQ
jgi:hypothetical protein